MLCIFLLAYPSPLCLCAFGFAVGIKALARAEPQKKITSMIERHTVIDQTDRNERLHHIIAVRSFHSIPFAAMQLSR
ncbi:hypothetical protein T11_16615 [Trichinella zimbabwensis]|uniref:Secreted protein n=1 Tax=Trichinella zimbabwensis TaxID=268475 RepID=A0A0V1HIL4_9BILA|nr:hypothetical protein T11_16615 [Trichinella zimbabwensis]